MTPTITHARPAHSRTNTTARAIRLPHTTLVLGLMVFCAALAQAAAVAGATSVERPSVGSAARAEARADTRDVSDPSTPSLDTVGSAARAADRFRTLPASTTSGSPAAPRSRGTR